ncbi:hypothetical protein BLOT_012281 [Blomia tropicalis]|nr:hypothetical protein BLOT_012281 [Blomia tropicalis]
MQIVCTENGVTIPIEKTIRSSCAMCPKEPLISANMGPLEKQSMGNGTPYYLCTVTCCDSENCTKPSTTNIVGKSIVSKTMSCPYSQYSNGMTMSRTNGQPSNEESANCPMCIKAQQSSFRPRMLLTTNPTYEHMKKTSNEDKVPSSPSSKVNNGQCFESNGFTRPNNKPTLTKVELSPTISKVSRQNSTRKSPKLQYLNSDTGKLHSPELSSSPPIWGNSSYTDCTDSFTPVCTSANSNPESNSKFLVGRKASPLDSEFSFYFSNVENHGFFRKAVPALPIAVAVLLCICNLVVPGSGTLVASLSIVMGSQTEYGPGYGCRSFCICFLSAVLQFSTAIFVFGWIRFDTVKKEIFTQSACVEPFWLLPDIYLLDVSSCLTPE